jgi:hypothetical protein
VARADYIRSIDCVAEIHRVTALEQERKAAATIEVLIYRKSSEGIPNRSRIPNKLSQEPKVCQVPCASAQQAEM